MMMKYVNLWVIPYLIIIAGCFSAPPKNRSNAPVESLQERTVSNCNVSQVASEETQSIIWKAVWDRDEDEVIALNDGRDNYTFSNAVSVDGKDIKVLLADRHLSLLLDFPNQSSSNSGFVTDLGFNALYVKNSDEGHIIQADLHVVRREDFRKVYDSDKGTLSDFPVTQIEACYALTTQKVENTVISVEPQGNGWKDLDQIESLFTGRKVYQTISSSAWKASDESDTLTAQTAMHVELVDVLPDNRIPVNIAFKQSNLEFNNSTSSVRPSITGLRIPRIITGVEIPLLWDSLDNEIFNLGLEKKTLNPFELVFGFSGGTNDEQMDFTISIQINELSNQTPTEDADGDQAQSATQAETPQSVSLPADALE